MNAREKYNRMVALIEEYISRAMDANEIIHALVRDQVTDSRSLGVIFRFMTDMSTYDYIRRRQLMCAYRALTVENCSIQEAIDISGIGTHSAFDKKFKQVFGMTPSEAKGAKNMAFYEEPFTWENMEHQTEKKDLSEQSGRKDMPLAIDRDQMELYRKLLELKELYGFFDFEADMVASFAREQHIDLSYAFELCADGITGFIHDMILDENTETSREEFEAYYTKVLVVAGVAIQIRNIVDISIERASLLSQIICDNHYKLDKDTLKFLLACEDFFYQKCEADTIRKAYDYFQDYDIAPGRDQVGIFRNYMRMVAFGEFYRCALEDALEDEAEERFDEELLEEEMNSSPFDDYDVDDSIVFKNDDEEYEFRGLPYPDTLNDMFADDDEWDDME